MKSLVRLSLGGLILFGAGCAITDYSLITSNNLQDQSNPRGIVNTNGKALIRQSVQFVTVWPDGSDNIVWYVDQAPNGDRTLTNYDLFTPAGSPLSWFQDYLYCNPGWVGCAVQSSDDPEVGDTDVFDYRWNGNCGGARSICIIVATSRYYGECGRVDRPPLRDRLAMAASGREAVRYGRDGLLFDIGPANLTIELSNERGEKTLLPITGRSSLWVSLTRGDYRAALDATNPVLAVSVRGYGDFLANHATYGKTDVTVTYCGVPVGWQIAGNRNGPVSSPQHVSEIANRF